MQSIVDGSSILGDSPAVRQTTCYTVSNIQDIYQKTQGVLVYQPTGLDDHCSYDVTNSSRN